MRKVAWVFVAGVVLLAASAGSTDLLPETLDRCGLEYIDCATGPTNNCIVGAVQVDDDCVRGCQRAYDACLRADELRRGPRPTPALMR